MRARSRWLREVAAAAALAVAAALLAVTPAQAAGSATPVVELDAPATATYGDPVDLTVTVAGDAGTPTGTVTVTTGSAATTTLATGDLEDGVLEVEVSDDRLLAALQPGDDTLTATYAGDDVYAAGADDATVTVVRAPGPDAEENGTTTAPLMGWSSWSLQATRRDGVNPHGSYSWLTEDAVLAQADAMAAKLKKHGYRYLNIDAGWWRKWDWTPEYDEYGRYAVDPTRFPDGMRYVADYIHDLGLKVGIYVPVGLEKGAYDNGDFPIEGSDDCTTHDVVYDDLRTTNGWDSSYAMDFSRPCAQEYIDSLARQYARWGIDFLKIDGVGYGSGRTTARETYAGQYDNRADIAAWNTAFDATGRDVKLALSWSIDQDYSADWSRLSDSWRVSFDVECYCDTLTTWSGFGPFAGGVKSRFASAAQWADEAGWDSGWNDFDSLDVGNGDMDGLTQDERRTAYTLWAISAAPLYLGDDLTQLDDFGLDLVTNDEVIAIDQAGIPARPVSTATDQQVWTSHQEDGSYVVALFNQADSPATVSTDFATDLGTSGEMAVRDVWAGTDLDPATSFSAQVPAHGVRLLRVSAVQPAPATSTTTVHLPARARYGSTLHARVRVASDGESTPTGSVSVRVGDHELTSAALVGGRVTLAVPTTSLDMGPVTLRFVYSGDDSTDGSAATARVVVVRAKATTRLRATPPRLRSGGVVRATVRVSAPGTTATGTVRLLDRGRQVGRARLAESDDGTVVVRAVLRTRGVHRLRAVYGGSSTVAGDTSPVRAVRVT